MKILALLLMMSFGIRAIGQTSKPLDSNPQNWPYNMKTFARAIGNNGGWWSFMNESEKSAFLDGYKEGMNLANLKQQNVCTVVMDRVKNDPNATLEQISESVFVCSQVAETTGYEKVSLKNLDEFYSNSLNQYVILEWAMPYLRDKATGRKTDGQLLDAWQAEQKDVHDCNKYPHICKAGIVASPPPIVPRQPGYITPERKYEPNSSNSNSATSPQKP